MKKTHGKSKHHLFYIWMAMNARCYNTSNAAFKDYGGRGVTVCPEWVYDFQAFYDWATTNGWKKGLEIHRNNNDASYSPSNCVWLTKSEHAKIPTRKFRMITFDNKTLSLSGWGRLLGCGYQRIQQRLDKGWSIERALTEPRKINQHQ